MNFTQHKFLSIENLNFSYGKHPILKSISCEITERKMTGIIGPNGCGKSTLLKNILGFYSCDFTSFSILGKNWKDRKSTRLNSSHANISYAVFCLKKKTYTWDTCSNR